MIIWTLNCYIVKKKSKLENCPIFLYRALCLIKIKNSFKMTTLIMTLWSSKAMTLIINVLLWQLPLRYVWKHRMNITTAECLLSRWYHLRKYILKYLHVHVVSVHDFLMVTNEITFIRVMIVLILIFIWF